MNSAAVHVNTYHKILRLFTYTVRIADMFVSKMMLRFGNHSAETLRQTKYHKIEVKEVA